MSFSTPRERLAELLEDPRTKSAAGIAGARWLEHQDDARLAADLDFIIAELDRQTPKPEPEPKPDPRDLALRGRVNSLMEQGKSVYPVVEPVLELLGRGAYDAAAKRLDALEQNLQQIRSGSDVALILRWRGEFLAGTEYEAGDVVRLAEWTYVALRATTSTPQPLAGRDDWAVLATPSGGSGVPGTPGPAGPPGPPGPPGSGTGTENLFVQKDNPNMTSPGVWIELRDDLSIRTFWVETGA